MEWVALANVLMTEFCPCVHLRFLNSIVYPFFIAVVVSLLFGFLPFVEAINIKNSNAGH